MKKISNNLNISSIFLEPHFEDYEEVLLLQLDRQLNIILFLTLF